MTELYYRDLNKESQLDFKRWFETAGRIDLLKAIAKGDDVVLGESFEDVMDCKVA